MVIYQFAMPSFTIHSTTGQSPGHLLSRLRKALPSQAGSVAEGFEDGEFQEEGVVLWNRRKTMGTPLENHGKTIGKWWFFVGFQWDSPLEVGHGPMSKLELSWCLKSWSSRVGKYPLVKVYKKIYGKIHHLARENLRTFDWAIFNSQL